jgi:hypothetical protein
MPGWRSAVGAVSAVLSAFFLAGLLATSAWPRMHAGPNQLEAGHRLQGTIAPLDGAGSFATPAAAYSLRRLKSTYAGPGIKLRRTTGGTQDIGFLGFTGFTGAPLDTAAAAAFCAATTCFIDTWYDQSGNARHATQATAGSQPAFIFNCIGTQPCARSTTGAQWIGYTPATPGAAVSFGAVAKRTGTGDCYWITDNSTNGFLARTAGTWQVIGGGAATAGAADGVWHAGVGLMNGVSSLVRVDATEGSTANVVIAPDAGQPIYLVAFAGASTTCDMTEGVLWESYGLAVAERAALTNNQRNFWGF